MASANIPQGKNVEYAKLPGSTGLQYGNNDLQDAVEQIPTVEAKLTLVGAAWNASRIEGASLVSVSALAAGVVTVTLLLDEPTGVNGTTRLAQLAQLYTPGRPCGLSVKATTTNTTVDGDTLAIEIEAGDALTGAALAAFASGDQINIVVTNP